MPLIEFVLASLFLTAPVEPRVEQYEVARRLRAFEAAWEKSDAAGRERGVQYTDLATERFSPGLLGEAGRMLDRATFALQTDAGPAVARQWGWSLAAIPATRVVDGSAKELAVTIRPFYPLRGDVPAHLELQLWFINKRVVTVKPTEFPVTVKVPLPPLGDARGLDRKLYFLADVGKELHPVAIGISQIADLRERLNRLPRPITGKEATIERATARARAALIRAALDSRTPVPSTDLPYADLLANAETMLDGQPFFTAARHGQFWLSVPNSTHGAVPCRIFVPKGLAKDKPVPIVVALHGHGGDENSFFEQYGAGRVVAECEKRGWVLIAPRVEKDGSGPPVAELVGKLAERYPIDRKRVFVVGHALGADRALAQVAEGNFRALALLDGNGMVGAKVVKSAALAKLPVFLGGARQGQFQFMSARGLHRFLTEAGATNVTYKEYPGVDSLLLVRSAAADVFALFDAAARE